MIPASDVLTMTARHKQPSISNTSLVGLNLESRGEDHQSVIMEKPRRRSYSTPLNTYMTTLVFSPLAKLRRRQNALGRVRLVIIFIALGCMYLTFSISSERNRHQAWLDEQEKVDWPELDSTPVERRMVGKHYVLHGHLAIDPEDPVHPVETAIRLSNMAWNAKVKRQSKSLKAAIREYKRRYQQNPPKGFDLWWRYVV